jgi:hypothetical protein
LPKDTVVVKVCSFSINFADCTSFLSWIV